MNITDKQVKRIAALAKLALQEEDVQDTRADLARILDYMRVLEEIPQGCIKPMETVSRPRPDTAAPSLGQPEVLQNTPHRCGALFLVPRTVE